MTGARRAAAIAAGVVLVVTGAVHLGGRALDGRVAAATSGGSEGRAASVVSGIGPAASPFTGLTAGTIRVGGRPLDVVVADRLGERIQGLRGRADAAPYAGMLFVFPDDTTTAFTMAGVPDALEIAFFDSRGRRVDALRMEPCAGTDATCPVYESSAPFRFTLETAPGEMPGGRLRVRRG
ncbi:MAG: hypothetical protein FJW95_03475 [Actinobacteria bacterium]|nr:hypothetical protein [Actinomycetota bacterium]